MAFNEEDKSEAYESTKIIVDNDDVLFVESNSYTSAKYFGPDFVSKYYANKYRNGDLFFLFDKKDLYPQSEPHIYTIFRTYPRGNKKGTKTEILDPREREIEFSELVEKFPQIENEIVDTLGISDTYTAMLNISKGVEMTGYELSRIDDLIVDIRFNEANPKKSMVTLKFDSTEDYAKLFYEDENEIWFINAIYSSYSDYEFQDYYWSLEDWKGGYILRDFSDENITKVKEILNIISPEHADLSDDSSYESASLDLLKIFEYEIDQIINDHNYEMNICKRKTAETEIEDELCDPFINYGIFAKGGCFWKYVTTVNVLLSLYRMYKTKSDNLTELLTKLARGLNVSKFQEYSYETQCNDFDDESFQRTVSRQLDTIIEKLEDGEIFGNISHYKEIVDKVLSKYSLNRLYNLPANPKISFRITKVDPQSNKIFVTVFKGSLTSPSEQRSYDLEGFNNFLHTPELFEQKIRRFNK